MTTNNPFKPATRSQSKLRMAIMGASGSGKSFTALKIASGLGSKIAAIDTERGSLSKYAGMGIAFDVLELTDYSPRNYIAAIQAAVTNGYEVLVIDSLSHAWSGTGGILETVDKAAKRSQSNNSFAAWRDVTPLHNQLVDTILGANIHIVVTMRSKTEYVLEKDERTGKTTPRKVGLAPVQRDGMEYEFDVVAEMDQDHNLMISKTRCIELDNAVITKPDAELGQQLRAWLSDGTPAPMTTTPLQVGDRPGANARAISQGDLVQMDDSKAQSPNAIREREAAQVVENTPEATEPGYRPLMPGSPTDDEFDDIALSTRTPVQLEVGLVEPPKHPRSTRTWDLGKVKTYTIQERKYINVKGATAHFDALITKMEASLRITDTSTTEEVCRAIDAHYSEKEPKAS